MMIGTIMTAVGLAEKVGLVDYVGELLGGNNGKEVAQRVVDTAQLLTGESNPEKAISVIAESPELQQKLREKILDQKHELDKLAFANTSEARKMYEAKSEQANRIAESVMKYSLPLIFSIAALNVAGGYLIEDKTIGCVAKFPIDHKDLSSRHN